MDLLIMIRKVSLKIKTLLFFKLKMNIHKNNCSFLYLKIKFLKIICLFNLSKIAKLLKKNGKLKFILDNLSI